MGIVGSRLQHLAVTHLRMPAFYWHPIDAKEVPTISGRLFPCTKVIAVVPPSVGLRTSGSFADWHGKCLFQPQCSDGWLDWDVGFGFPSDHDYYFTTGIHDLLRHRCCLGHPYQPFPRTGTIRGDTASSLCRISCHAMC